MNTKRIILGILAVLGAVVFSTTGAYAELSGNLLKYIRNNPDGSQTLTGHIPSEIKKATTAFKYHASLSMNGQIIMPLGNQSQLSKFIQDLYDPKSPSFHHFLTPAQFARQFATSTVDSIQVQEFLRQKGISVTGESSNGAVLNVTGPSKAFEQAFGLHVNYYQKSDGRMFFAPDADPTIPVTLTGKILAVGGLDNLPKYQAHVEQYANALPKAVGSGPGGFLAPNDVKTAYNLNSITANGAGQNVALFELDGYSSNDITAYESSFGLPNVPVQNIFIDGFNGVPNYGSNGGASEVTLDIELVAAFAPGSNNIFVYQAANTMQSWIDEWNQIAADDKANVISCSWGEPEQDSPTVNFDNTVFQQMAAQGQAVFVASGDNGAFDAGDKTLAVDEPAAQPSATAVGISKLTTSSGEVYSSETASVYGGGGVSANWSIPSYQTSAASHAAQAALVSTTMRNLPDVVLTSDASTAYAFYINGSWGGWYGSSIASPIWASFISRVNQGLGQNAPLGSVNSALYQLAQTSNYANDFHDINTKDNGYYPAEPGFDDATGLGSFNGLNLYNDLVKTFSPVSPVVAITSPASGNSFTAGANVAITATASESNGTINKVDFYNGTTLLGTVTSSPYTYNWNNVAAGNYSLTAVATDANGVAVTSSAVTITVIAAAEIIDDTDPNKILTTGAWPSSTSISGYYGTEYRTDDNALKGTKSIKYTPGLLGGAGSYQVYIRYTSSTNRATNVPVDIIHSGVTTTVTLNQQTKGGAWVLLGTYSFLGNASGEGVTIRTNSTNGYVIADAVEFTQVTGPSSSSSPVVAITSPANGSTVAAGSNITITASASETNGIISKVAFYNGTALLGTVNSSPYSFTWNNVPAGNYSLTAAATDTNGVSVTSSPVTGRATAPPEIIDDTTPNKVIITGAWPSSTAVSGYYGTGYLTDNNALQGTKSVQYIPALLGGAGSYKVYIRYTSSTNRATNVPVDILHSGVTTTITLNQQTKGGGWFLLGTYNFLGNASGEGVTIRNNSTNGYVIADAVEFTN